MDIHEYQAKEILSRFGVPVPKGALAYSPEQAAYRAREIGGKLWVVKAQVHTGGRGKAGGVKLCRTEDEVADAADELLGDYLRLPLQTLKVGAQGTWHMLGVAKFKRARFLLASTSEVYGDPQVHPQPEEYWGNVNPIGPRGVYDEAKRYAEALTMAYHRQQGVDTAIVRIFNTYGPRMRPHDGRAVPTFLRQALLGQDLTVFGDGSQTRSFCYVDDLVEGLIGLAESEEHLPVNIGNPDEFTLKELAEKVIEATGADSGIVYEPLPTDDPQVRRPDITRAREILDWEPSTALEDGLAKTVELSGVDGLVGRAD
jgi:dTDP-glucose 4,6-dehydratase